MALPKVLAWLHDHNPLVAAYKSTVQDVERAWEDLRDHMAKTGLAIGLENAVTKHGRRVMDELGAEHLAMLVPVDALDAPALKEVQVCNLTQRNAETGSES